jgi:hypothetical protein
MNQRGQYGSRGNGYYGLSAGAEAPSPQTSPPPSAQPPPASTAKKVLLGVGLFAVLAGGVYALDSAFSAYMRKVTKGRWQ